jgi:hypothetical protein
MTDEALVVAGSPLTEVVNEVLDHPAARVAELLGAAELGGVGLHQGRIEAMLADQLAETVAEARLAVVAIGAVIALMVWIQRAGQGTKLLDRTEADAVGLAQGPVDGACLGDAQFAAVEPRRYIGRIGIPVTREAPGARTLVDDSLEDPAASGRIGKPPVD